MKSKPELLYIIIPALNEGKNIGLVLTDLKRANLEPAQVFVADNSSTDATAEVARNHGATVITGRYSGYGAACLAGISAAEQDLQGRGNPDTHKVLVAFIDGDYSDYPEDFVVMIEQFRDDKIKFVLGSRLLLADAKAAVPPVARFGNWATSSAIRLLYKKRFTDLGPMRIIRLAALQQLKMQDQNWGWTIEMQLKVAQMNLGFVEVPVRYRPRFSGKSKISGSLIGGSKAAVKIILVLLVHVLKPAPSRHLPKGQSR